jgi:hypothetical protein
MRKLRDISCNRIPETSSHDPASFSQCRRTQRFPRRARVWASGGDFALLWFGTLYVVAALALLRIVSAPPRATAIGGGRRAMIVWRWTIPFSEMVGRHLRDP